MQDYPPSVAEILAVFDEINQSGADTRKDDVIKFALRFSASVMTLQAATDRKRHAETITQQ